MRVIRAMQPEHDMSAVVALWCQASIISHDFIPAQYWREACSLMREVYLPQANTVVMVEQDEIIGFVSSIEHQIAALFVASEHQGKGVGSALLAHALRGREVATLNVYAANLRARHFYEQHGFHVTGNGVDDATGALECFMEYRAAV